ncbi:hypothetical protein B296_00053261 [Ensete ventricosum]|uniref:Uncharacterized protein n=1 Tax=Ensete ventricosum TaxID=4639 RepID=A0A426X3C0_ENSVE|nr:hypothetical protein B296_00053261 [Ensete ventricosum]
MASCGQPAGAIVTRGHSRLQRRARKRGRLQGAHKGLPPAAIPAASNGDGASLRGGRPLERGGDSGTHDAVVGDYDAL